MSERPGRIVNVNGRNRRPWALASRERILKAAIDEIAEVGFEKARLVDIAKRADLTVGSVYTWFQNKEELFRAALEDSIESQQ
jgi:AcrR family transcriptional regulator